MYKAMESKAPKFFETQEDSNLKEDLEIREGEEKVTTDHHFRSYLIYTSLALPYVTFTSFSEHHYYLQLSDYVCGVVAPYAQAG